MRRGHPLAASPVLTLDAHCAAEHVRVSFACRPRGFVDEALVARAPPMPLPRIDVGMLWHRRHAHAPAARWLHETVREAVRGLDLGEFAADPGIAPGRDPVDDQA